MSGSYPAPIQGVQKVGEIVTDSVNKGVNFVTNNIGNVKDYAKSGVQNLYESTTSTMDKSGVSDVFNKLMHFQALNELDMTKMIILLLAAIVIIIVVFIIPKYNKSSKFMKLILDNKIIKILICCVLFYAFYQYNVEVFIVMLVIVFALYWFHNGYVAEHYGPIETINIGSEYYKLNNLLNNDKAAVIKKTGHNEIVVDDLDNIKEDIIAEDKKNNIISEVNKENEIKSDIVKNDNLKEDDKSFAVDQVVNDSGDNMANYDFDNVIGVSNNNLEVIKNQENIFDQRDFMIQPEVIKEQKQAYNRICDCTKCTKPTSYVEQRLF